MADPPVDKDSLNDRGNIELTVSEAEEIEADHADLLVTVHGASLFTGQTALAKAREVAQLVAALQAAGIESTDIRLQGVRADVSSGVLGKTSSATYSLKIRCARLETLAEALGAITSQKNTNLQRIVWGYTDNEEQRLQWLDKCIARANSKAKRIASGLGAHITGIVHFAERHEDPEAKAVSSYSGFETQAMGRSKARAMGPEDLGMEVSHRKTVVLTIHVTYQIAMQETTHPL